MPDLPLPAPENRRFYPAVDGLRGVAVLMVFCAHYLGRVPLLGWGFTGVNAFFVLSGFLITGILYDTRNAMGRTKTFYARRVLRIFPLYYLVLLVAVLLTPVFHWVYHPAALLLPIYLSNFARIVWAHDALTRPMVVDHLVAGIPLQRPFALYFGHFWSLAIEEQFYLVWPPVVFWIKDRVTLRNLCLAALPLCLLGRILGVHLLPGDLLNAGVMDRFTPFRVDSLLLGGFLALTLRGPEAPRIAQLARPLLVALPLAFLAMQITYLVRVHTLYPLYTGTWLVTFGFTLIDLFAAAVLLRTIHPSSLVYRVFNHPVLRFFGRISYGFYVLHEIPHQVYERICYAVLPRDRHIVYPCAALLAFVCTTALASLSFRYFEAPILQLKKRFTVASANLS